MGRQRLKSKWLIPLMAVVTVMYVLVFSNTYVSAHALSNFDIKTANAPTVTAASIDKHLKDSNAGASLQGKGKAILDLSNATGVNAAFFLGKIMNESGWARSEHMNKYYNYGNMFNVSGDAGMYKFMQNGKDRKGAAFSTPEAGLKATIELLDTYYKTGIGGSGQLKTVKQVLNKWAPESDNNNHDQIMSNIQIIAKGFGQDLATGGSVSVGTGEYKTEEVQKTGKKVGELVEPMIDFVEIDYSQGQTTGVNTDDTAFAKYVLVFDTYARQIYDFSFVVVAFMVVGLIFYIFAGIALVVIGYNGLFGDSAALQKASDVILGNDVTYDKKGVLKLMARAIGSITIIAMVLAGVYTLGYAALFKLLDLVY